MQQAQPLGDKGHQPVEGRSTSGATQERMLEAVSCRGLLCRGYKWCVAYLSH
jgi:hypothetical protein